jgi:hypothetical protein
MTKRWRSAAHAAALVVAVCLAGIAALGEASASSRICRDLEGQLTRVGAGGSPARARQFEKAIADQRAQIVKAERQLRRAGCSGGAFERGGAASACQSIAGTLSRMQTNLASLERRHRQLGGGGNPSRERARILASLEANGCRGATVERRQDEPVSRDGSLFSRLFGGGVERRIDDPADRPDLDAPRQRIVIRNGSRIEVQPRLTGTFRTLCVRSCDGYFFPVAYSSSASDLDRDAAACQAMCPGTAVELYMHRTPDEEPEQMISRAGVPYASLPVAFSYRQPGVVRDPSCSCSASQPRGFTIIGGDRSAPGLPPAAEAVGSILPMPLPRARPDPATDPETLANRAGGLDQAALLRLLLPYREARFPVASNAAVSPEEPAERRVRVVGPAFLPDPEGAIDLRAPVPTEVR